MINQNYLSNIGVKVLTRSLKTYHYNRKKILDESVDQIKRLMIKIHGSFYRFADQYWYESFDYILHLIKTEYIVI